MSDPQETSLAGRRIAVIGAGAIGLCVAVRLARSGARTLLFDPADAREEASGVAAGMLAPVGEALYDDLGHLTLWRAAAERWPAFAATISGMQIEPCGALFRGVAEPSKALDLTIVGDELMTREDARLDPWPALEA